MTISQKNIGQIAPNLKERIDTLKHKKHISFTRLSELIGITKAALFNSFDRNDFKLSTLYKIAKALDVSILEILIDEIDFQNNVTIRNINAHGATLETADLQKARMQVNYLEQLLKSKEDTISDLRILIEELRKTKI